MTATTTSTQLRELWLHTGTACNLECPFCLEGSKPGDTRLERLTADDIKPLVDEAVRLGVERLCFTGGEPLIVKDIVKILSYALQWRPCLVLTNGTAPLIKRAHQLQALRAQPQPLEFRVSIDHPDEQRHDAQRGWGNFRRALEGIRLLRHAGFEVSIARHAQPGEDPALVEERYREVLATHDLPPLKLAPLPELGRPTVGPVTDPPTAAELALSPHPLMCRYSRMIIKRAGALRVNACPLTDDDPRFELGASLSASLTVPIVLTHHRCGQCVRHGVGWG